MAALSVTETNFENDVLKAEGPVLVDFWAEWCGPCKALAPVLDELAEDKKEHVVVAKINIEEAPSIPAKYGVRGIPTLMLFKNGQVTATKVGALPKADLYDWVDSIV